MHGPDRSYRHDVKDYVDSLKDRKDLQVFDLPFADGVSLVRKADAPGVGHRDRLGVGMGHGSMRGEGPLWGITSYFNPLSSPVRRANYDLFRRRLGIPLVTVELTFGTGFELGADDAEHVVQLRGADVMWQKERLLNIALGALPAECRSVVWLDADVVFDDPAWPEGVERALEDHALVQPFAAAYLLLPAALRRRARTRFAHPAPFRRSRLQHWPCPADWMRRFGDHGGRKVGLGFAWAARRDLLDRHGFFDAAIIGGGDRALVCAAYGTFGMLIEKHRMNARQERRYLDWAVPFHADVGGRLGWLDGDLYHLWHGDIEGRHYAERHAALANIGFDPYADIAIADNGAWRWNSDKPELHRLLARVFRGPQRRRGGACGVTVSRGQGQGSPRCVAATARSGRSPPISTPPGSPAAGRTTTASAATSACRC